MDISVMVNGPGYLLEAIQEALEGATSIVQNLTFGPYMYVDISQLTTSLTDKRAQTNDDSSY